MFNKALVLVLAGALLAAGTAIEVSVVPWSPSAQADDDDDDRPRARLRFGRDLRLPRLMTRRAQPRHAAARREIVATGLAPADLDRLLTQGFTLLRTQQVSLLGTSLARLRVPRRLSVRQALETAARTAPNATFANNDLYRRLLHAAYRPSGGSCGHRCEAFEVTAWTQSIGRCGTDVRIGVVDTGVDLAHPSLVGAKVTLRTVRSPDRAASDMDHGTAVISLLVGKAGSEVAGIIPGAHVLVADAFHGKGQGSTADVYDLIVGIDWLASEGVAVLNLSLSGPDNGQLQRVIERVQDKGVLVVAASGRPDRSRMSGYPARYPGVIAVSAVDNRLRPSRLAMRGDHIAFAAPGAGIAVAQRPAGVRRVEGTSFAAPFVTAAYAVGLGRSHNRSELTDLLARSAKDLGSPGRDPIYGWGLLQFSALPSC
jgi:Subtilase family